MVSAGLVRGKSASMEALPGPGCATIRPYSFTLFTLFTLFTPFTLFTLFILFAPFTLFTGRGRRLVEVGRSCRRLAEVGAYAFTGDPHPVNGKNES